MNKNLRTRACLLAAVAGLGVCAGVRADITSFTPGDLVVYRGGNGSAPLTAAGTGVASYLDEYTTSGAYVGSVTLPTTGNAVMVDAAGDANHEGILTLSANGNWLTFTGYNSSTGSATNGTVAEISQSVSTLNTSTLMTGQGQPRGAVTSDGNEFWTASGAGVQYYPTVGGAPTTINSTWNGRDLVVVNNTNLVAGSGSNSFNASNGHGIQQIGTGLPTGALSATSDMQLLNNPSDTNDGTDLIFASLPGGNGNYDGYDVIYAVGGASGSQAITKWAYNSSNGLFNEVGSPITPAPVLNSSGGIVTTGGNNTLDGLTVGSDSSDNEYLYYTDLSGLFEITDTSETAYGAITGSAPTTPLVADGANEEILGVAFAPTAAVPEPTMLGLLAVTGMGLLSRRKRRA